MVLPALRIAADHWWGGGQMLALEHVAVRIYSQDGE